MTPNLNKTNTTVSQQQQKYQKHNNNNSNNIRNNKIPIHVNFHQSLVLRCQLTLQFGPLIILINM